MFVAVDCSKLDHVKLGAKFKFKLQLICQHNILCGSAYLIWILSAYMVFKVFQKCISRSEYSMQLNASRIKVLQAQDDLVNTMKEAAAKELLQVSHHHNELVEIILPHHQDSYKKLLHNLIVQVWWTLIYTIFSSFFFWTSRIKLWDLRNWARILYGRHTI